MRPLRRTAAALASAALASAGLSACGSASPTVAQVQGASPISKSLLDHWIEIESILAYDTIPKAPIPAGVIAVPPHYSACIAFLATRPYLREHGTPKATPAQLKARCVQHFVEVKRKALGYMIAFRWVAGELARRGLTITQAEVRKAIRMFQIKDFRSTRQFENYMTYAHLTPPDLHFILEYTVMGNKLQKQGITRKALSPAEQSQELASFIRRWTAKTSCKPHYVVAGCKEYRGSETPL